MEQRARSGWTLDPELEYRTPSLRRAQVIEALRCAPWLWADAGAARDEAWRLVPSGPAALAVGVAPLLTWNAQSQRASLWALGGPRAETPLVGEGARCLPTGAAALSQTLPVLWVSLHHALAQTPAQAQRVVSLLGDRTTLHEPESRLDGRSPGISAALAIASRALDRALPGDLAASATLDREGLTGPVDGLSAKLQLLALGAPGVRRVLLHPSQRDEALRLLARLDAAARIEVVSVGSLHDALLAAFGEDLVARTLAVQSAARREDRIEALFELALGDHGRGFAWAPVERTAEGILARWELSAEQRRKVELIHGIAARHGRNQGQASIPDAGWLASVPAPRRLHLIAHIVQQSTDTASPPHAEAEALARRHLVRGVDAFAPHLRLLGALARLVEIQGRHAEALEAQQEALEAWMRLGERGVDLSFPLAAVYRLATMLSIEGAFLAAEAVFERASLWAGRDPSAGVSTPFVRLWRSVARLTFTPSSAGAVHRAALEELVAVGDAAELLPHVRASARRQLLRVNRHVGAELRVDDLGDPAAAATFSALAALDLALAEGQDGDAALGCLAAAMPQPTAAMIAVARTRGEPPARWVARFFPY